MQSLGTTESRQTPKLARRPTLYTLTVDTEEEWDWNGPCPIENLSLRNIDVLPRFQEICSRHGAAVTYFANHAVMSDPKSRNTIQAISRNPHVEIGLHIHPWNTPPIPLPGPVKVRDTFLNNLPPDLARAKLETTYNAFSEEGIQPTSFRGGRFSTGPVVQDFLREHGFVADASILPFSTWEDEGAPDYRHRRPYPVRLAARRANEAALWEIPVTLGFSRRPFGLWHRLHECVMWSPLRHLRLIGLAERLGMVRKVWLSFESPLGRNLIPFLKLLRSMRLPCIDFMVHSSSLLPGGSGFSPTKAESDRVFTNVNEVLGIISQWSDFQPATVSEVAHQLELNHARTGN